MIFVDSADDPGTVFRNFTAVTGLEIPAEALAGSKTQANPSMSRVEAALMAGLSESHRWRTGPDSEYRHAQQRMLRLFATEDWQAARPATPVAYPNDWAGWMGDLAARTVAGLRALEKAGRIRILGDIERLDDVARPYKWPGIDIHRGAPMTAATIVTIVRNHGDKLHEMLDGVWNQ